METVAKPLGLRVTEFLGVPREARKPWAGGLFEVLRGLDRMAATSSKTPGVVKAILAALMVGFVPVKFALEGKSGDKAFGLDRPLEEGETVREPNGAAEFLTGGRRLAPEGGAPMFVIQVLNVLNYGLGAITNSPLASEQVKHWSLKAIQFVLGPLQGLAEALGHDLLTRTTVSAAQGAMVGATS